jgi:hypothetical protein
MPYRLNLSPMHPNALPSLGEASAYPFGQKVIALADSQPRRKQLLKYCNIVFDSTIENKLELGIAKAFEHDVEVLEDGLGWISPENC